MEEKAKSVDIRELPAESEPPEKTESDPESAKRMQIAKRVAERYADASQRLADS